VAYCLSILKIFIGDSRDEFNRTVFNAFPFEHREYGHPFIPDHVCCSNYSFVSAHYMLPANMLLLDQVIKVMGDEYASGILTKQPSYDDIAQRYTLNLKILNMSSWQERN
jgi:hypothetical protein